MITDEDIRKLTIAFKDRQESDADIADLKDHFNLKFDNAMTKMDQVYGEVINLRDEQKAHAQRHDDLEEDIRQIKSLPSIAHQLKKK